MPSELTQLASPSLAGLCAMFVVALLTGLLVPSRTLNRELGQEKQRAEDYKAAWAAADQRADKLLEQQDQLLVYARTADAALQALRTAAERGRR